MRRSFVRLRTRARAQSPSKRTASLRATSCDRSLTFLDLPGPTILIPSGARAARAPGGIRELPPPASAKRRSGSCRGLGTTWTSVRACVFASPHIPPPLPPPIVATRPKPDAAPSSARTIPCHAITTPCHALHSTPTIPDPTLCSRSRACLPAKRCATVSQRICISRRSVSRPPTAASQPATAARGHSRARTRTRGLGDPCK